MTDYSITNYTPPNKTKNKNHCENKTHLSVSWTHDLHKMYSTHFHLHTTTGGNLQRKA